MAVIPGATNKLKALELSKFSEEATYEYVLECIIPYMRIIRCDGGVCVVRVCVVSTSTEILMLSSKHPAMRPME